MATRADVAKLAGVSASTVSYALSGARPISTATRARIVAAMRQLGYTPNALASGLAGRRSKILALLFPSRPRALDNVDLGYIVAAADLARERGYHLVLWPLGDGDLSEIRRLGGSGLVDGVLLMEVRMQDDRVRYLRSAGLPLALIGRTAQPGRLAYADADFESIAVQAIEHLTGLGHRCVGFLNVSQTLIDLANGASVRLAEGLSRAAARAGLRLVTLACENSVAAGRAALGTLRRRAAAMTAVVSFNWEATVGLMQRAAAEGLAIPADLSVLAITDVEARAEITTPALTTICPSAVEIGRASTAALIDLLERPEAVPGQLLLPGRLTRRGSTGPVPDGRPPRR